MYVHQHFTQVQLQAAGLKVLRSQGKHSLKTRYDIVQEDDQVLMVVQARGDVFYTSGDLYSERTQSLVNHTIVFDSAHEKEYALQVGVTQEDGWIIKVTNDGYSPPFVVMESTGGYVGEQKAKTALTTFLGRHKLV